ncbi:protein ORF41 [Lake sturgeon herpesvirus]|nr:protein ORF41 [Lake sturgeon herpesvirus]
MVLANHLVDLSQLQSQVSAHASSGHAVKCHPRLSVHVVIAELYLGSCRVGQKRAMICLTLEEARMFAACLYLHYLGHVDHLGSVTGPHAFKRRAAPWRSEMIGLARDKGLDWLVTLLTKLNAAVVEEKDGC